MNTIARGRELFTQDQRNSFMEIPEDECSIGSYYTLSNYDIEIINKRRRPENKIGFAIQLSVLRYPGWSYTHIENIPSAVIEYISKQINVSTEAFKGYPKRENTLWEHLNEIRDEYKFISFTADEYKLTLEYVSRLALENENTIYLITECLDFLRKNRIILPAITTLERLIWESKEYAEKKIVSTIAESLTIAQKSKLDEVLSLNHPNDSTKTLLAWLKEPIGFPSPDNFLKVVDKIEYIRKLNLELLKINHLHQNRINQIYKLGFRYEPYAFRRFDKDKRYTILVIFLLNLSKELTDKAFDIHDRQILSLLSKGRKAQEEIQKQNGKKLNEKVIHFANMGSALIKSKDEGVDPFDAIKS